MRGFPIFAIFLEAGLAIVVPVYVFNSICYTRVHPNKHIFPQFWDCRQITSNHRYISIHRIYVWTLIPLFNDFPLTRCSIPLGECVLSRPHSSALLKWWFPFLYVVLGVFIYSIFPKDFEYSSVEVLLKCSYFAIKMHAQCPIFAAVLKKREDIILWLSKFKL